MEIVKSDNETEQSNRQNVSETMTTINRQREKQMIDLLADIIVDMAFNKVYEKSDPVPQVQQRWSKSQFH